jgi:hypothetical protein
MHFLIFLFFASFFSPFARYFTLALWLTVLLPAKPVLWNRFCRWAVVGCNSSTAQHSPSSSTA